MVLSLTLVLLVVTRPSGQSRPMTDPPVERGEPAALLARSLALLDGMTAGSPPLLRWYVPASRALVLGRGQRPEDVRTDLPVLRRHTGGGAVLFDADLLSLDLVLPAGHALLRDDLGAVFLAVGAAWAAALAGLGVGGLSVHRGPAAGRLGGGDPLRAAICYAAPGRGEVLHDGRKLVGLAQRRRRNGALVQCGLLWRWRPAPLLAAFGADPADPAIHGAAVGLRDLADGPPDEAAIVAAVEGAVRDSAKGV
jgi:lipoate-protein ligase A